MKKGGKKYFAWRGQSDQIAGIKFKRFHEDWPMFTNIAYSDAWRMQSNVKAAHEFRQSYVRAN